MKKATQNLKKKELLKLIDKQLNSPKRFIISPINLKLLKKRGIDIKGYLKDLKKVNANKTIYHGLGYTIKDLKHSGLTDTEIRGLGYIINPINKKKTNKKKKDIQVISKKKLSKTKGKKKVTLSLLLKKKTPTKKMLSLGYNSVRLKEKKYSAKRLKKLGFGAKYLFRLGLSATDLKNAKFTLKEIKTAGYSARELKEAGYSDSVCKTPSRVTESKGWKELMEEYFPAEKIYKIHKKLKTRKS